MFLIWKKWNSKIKKKLADDTAERGVILLDILKHIYQPKVTWQLTPHTEQDHKKKYGMEN